ncbi:MAG TPA: hypothetical protein VLB51_01815 [Methylomirabilota bacterium]|nr:hypothetical protein [Methylomirabilota bacterium]
METAFVSHRVTAPDGALTVDGRLDRPDLLIVGGTSRHSGKTERAGRLNGRHAPSMPVVGLKVTTVDRSDGHCPHGGDGCGVCSTLEAPWIVSRELDRSSAKDSCRLLAGGAHRVYWLRVLRSELAEGAADLVTRVPPGWVGVGESSSLVSVVEPGLFLLVRAAGSTRAKPSARAVAHLADRVVVSDGRSFDLDLDRISVVAGQWALRREACAVVIGGADDRPGADRDAALRRTVTSLVAQFDRVVVRPETADRSDLAGAAAALPDLPDTWCLVTKPVAGGISPGLVNAMFRRRAGIDVVVAVTRSEGRNVDLALCRRELVAEVVAALGRGVGAAAALGDRCAVRELRPEAPGSEAGIGRLPVTVQTGSAADPACRRGAGAS